MTRGAETTYSSEWYPQDLKSFISSEILIMEETFEGLLASLQTRYLSEQTVSESATSYLNRCAYWLPRYRHAYEQLELGDPSAAHQLLERSIQETNEYMQQSLTMGEQRTANGLCKYLNRIRARSNK